MVRSLNVLVGRVLCFRLSPSVCLQVSTDSGLLPMPFLWLIVPMERFVRCCNRDGDAIRSCEMSVAD